ncbi:helix-turn-helix transcriptional regulator [Streptomyces argyrophyllae]|uniref:Helix-turn-helix transcriptional regulator n=1 Tax=Streptomyces argyrophylli TaxID=2726118 RepID=A0A6M4PRG5_9ACTN|nr:helix-turn-helix transcriptional regulator [Streptomyces argyrophyllae]QJS13214.1 helix-turn-helix transcriptional regulator [Streptomyces argyrophyllae]
MASTTSPRWAPLPVGFGIMLRNARVDAGLSREALGAALLASAGTVQGLEEEHRPPSATVAARLAHALNLDPWRAAIVHAVAVDDAALRTRQGTQHTRYRRPRTSGESPTVSGHQ